MKDPGLSLQITQLQGLLYPVTESRRDRQYLTLTLYLLLGLGNVDKHVNRSDLVLVTKAPIKLS
jgi:hypothetical protein